MCKAASKSQNKSSTCQNSFYNIHHLFSHQHGTQFKQINIPHVSFSLSLFFDCINNPLFPSKNPILEKRTPLINNTKQFFFLQVHIHHLFSYQHKPNSKKQTYPMFLSLSIFYTASITYCFHQKTQFSKRDRH